MKQTATVWTPRRRRTRGDARAPRPRRAGSPPRRRSRCARSPRSGRGGGCTAARRPCRRPRGRPSCRGGSRSRRGSRCVVTIAAGGRLPRDQRVRGHGGAVREEHDVAQVDARPRRRRRTTPSIGSAVEGTLRPRSSPPSSSRTQMSVNVPPTSTATASGMCGPFRAGLTACRLRVMARRGPTRASGIPSRTWPPCEATSW